MAASERIFGSAQVAAWGPDTISKLVEEGSAKRSTLYSIKSSGSLLTLPVSDADLRMTAIGLEALPKDLLSKALALSPDPFELELLRVCAEERRRRGPGLFICCAVNKAGWGFRFRPYTELKYLSAAFVPPGEDELVAENALLEILVEYPAADSSAPIWTVNSASTSSIIPHLRKLVDVSCSGKYLVSPNCTLETTSFSSSSSLSYLTCSGSFGGLAAFLLLAGAKRNGDLIVKVKSNPLAFRDGVMLLPCEDSMRKWWDGLSRDERSKRCPSCLVDKTGNELVQFIKNGQVGGKSCELWKQLEDIRAEYVAEELLSEEAGERSAGGLSNSATSSSSSQPASAISHSKKQKKKSKNHSSSAAVVGLAAGTVASESKKCTTVPEHEVVEGSSSTQQDDVDSRRGQGQSNRDQIPILGTSDETAVRSIEVQSLLDMVMDSEARTRRGSSSDFSFATTSSSGAHYTFANEEQVSSPKSGSDEMDDKWERARTRKRKKEPRGPSSSSSPSIKIPASQSTETFITDSPEQVSQRSSSTLPKQEPSVSPPLMSTAEADTATARITEEKSLSPVNDTPVVLSSSSSPSKPVGDVSVVVPSPLPAPTRSTSSSSASPSRARSASGSSATTRQTTTTVLSVAPASGGRPSPVLQPLSSSSSAAAITSGGRPSPNLQPAVLAQAPPSPGLARSSGLAPPAIPQGMLIPPTFAMLPPSASLVSPPPPTLQSTTTTMKPLPFPSSGFTSLHRDIEEMAASLDLVATRRQPWQLAVAERVKQVVYSIWPRAWCDVFGSIASGLAAPCSDVDMVVRGVPQADRVRVLAQHLEREEWVQMVQAVERTAVPVVKFNTAAIPIAFGNRGNLIAVDITFENEAHHGLNTCGLVRQFVQRWPPLKPLVLVLKQFLVEKGLNDPYVGGISSYGLVLMVAAILRRHWPSGMTSKADLGLLFVEFLQVYSSKEFLDKGVRFGNDGRRKPLGDPCFIEDPLDPNNNVGRSCFGIQQVMEHFSKALEAIRAYEQETSVTTLAHSSMLGRVFATSHHADVVRLVTKVWCPPELPLRTEASLRPQRFPFPPHPSSSSATTHGANGAASPTHGSAVERWAMETREALIRTLNQVERESGSKCPLCLQPSGPQHVAAQCDLVMLLKRCPL